VPQESFILVDRGKHSTTGSYGVVGQSFVPDTRVIKPLNADPTVFYFSNYDLFFQKNKFTGLESPRKDVTDLMKRGDPEGYLRDAMLCLGAMQALKLSEASTAKRIHRFALESYAKSISGLRHALIDMVDDVQSRASILWTTLLLGLFEVSPPILLRERPIHNC
jgi:hypothetical protein